MSIETLINALADNDKLAAKDAFEAEMKSRVDDAVDSMRVEVGKSFTPDYSQEEVTDEN